MPQERTDHTGFHANSGCYYNYQISIRCLLDPLYSARKPGRGFYREAQKKGHSPFQIWKGVLVPLTSEFTYQETSLNLIRGNETFQRPMYDTPETPLEAMNPAMKYTNSKGDRNSYPPPNKLEKFHLFNTDAHDVFPQFFNICGYTLLPSIALHQCNVHLSRLWKIGPHEYCRNQQKPKFGSRTFTSAIMG